MIDVLRSNTRPDTLPERLSRTLVGTIAERSVTLELRVEEGRIRAWIRSLDPPGSAPSYTHWFTGTVQPTGTLTLEEHHEELVARIRGRLEMDGGRLVLEGERRAIEDGGIQTVHLAGRELALGSGARLVSHDVYLTDAARAVVFYAEAPTVVEGHGERPVDPGLRRLDAALEKQTADDREWFIETFGRTEADSVRERSVWRRGASWYESSYDAWIAADRTLNVEATVSTYAAGTPHPIRDTWTLVWDLEEGTEKELVDLFRPGSQWLRMLSHLAVASLSEELGEKGNAEWIRSGAGPDPDNFSAWTATADGIRIVFDPYQVAPNAAGPQVAVIPWIALTPVLAADGPGAVPAPGSQLSSVQPDDDPEP